MLNIRRIIVTFPRHTGLWFKPIAVATCQTFRELGYEADVCPSSRVDDFNHLPYELILVVAPHGYSDGYPGVRPEFQKSKEKIYACWDLEQTPMMGSGEDVITCDIMEKNWERVKTYIHKYDFYFTEARSKTEFINHQGYNAETFNLGGHWSYARNLPDVQQDAYDLFFVGTLYPRRMEIIQRLMNHGLSMYPVPVTKVFDPETHNDLPVTKFFHPEQKATAIGSSKVCLNIHHNEIGYFEKPRIITDIMANQGFCITEDIQFPEYFENGIHFISAPYKNLVETVIDWCKRGIGERQRISCQAHSFINSTCSSKEFSREMLKIIASNG